VVTADELAARRILVFIQTLGPFRITRDGAPDPIASKGKRHEKC
jgi:hypothetical protein